ncbi:hypothetical protein GCM10009670_21930 [Citricoccus alkalitolerans]
MGAGWGDAEVLGDLPHADAALSHDAIHHCQRVDHRPDLRHGIPRPSVKVVLYSRTFGLIVPPVAIESYASGKTGVATHRNLYSHTSTNEESDENHREDMDEHPAS